MNRLRTLFLASIFPLVPKRLLSRITGVLMRIPLPAVIAPFVIRRFALTFGISWAEAEKSIDAYRKLDEFFTRALKAGARPVAAGVVHPVDGKLTVSGPISPAGQLLQAKGWTYTLAELLGDEALAQDYVGGRYFTYYLCPADYHRVHSAAAGNLVSAKHIPGLLWPVNEWSVGRIRRLFCLNERVILNFAGELGPWSLILVGATNVGHITIALDPSIATNRWMWHAPTDRRYVPAIPVKAGDEVGTFHLGSTVIAVFGSRFAFRADHVSRPVPAPVPEQAQAGITDFRDLVIARQVKMGETLSL